MTVVTELSIRSGGHRGVSALHGGTTPAAAQNAFRVLSETLYGVAREAAARASESLHGLAEAFANKVLVNTGGKVTGPLGYFAGNKWRHDADHYHELHINVGHASHANLSPRAHAEDVLDTILHELVHFYCRENNIRDVSGRGRYHNRQFALHAHAIGLRVVKTNKSHVGFASDGLNQRGHQIYGDLIDRIEDALRLTSAPLPASAPSNEIAVVAGSNLSAGDLTAAISPSKYVFAQCGCRDLRGRPRTLRMARGWWEPGTVACGNCRQLFAESPPPAAENRTSNTTTA